MAKRRRNSAESDRVAEWISARPEWLRPPLIGATMLFTVVGLKMLLALPVLAYFIWRDGPRTAVILVVVLVAVAAAGACGGLAYSLIGVHLRRLGRPGAYAAGIACVAGYMLPLLLAMPYMDTRPDSFSLRDRFGQFSALCAVVVFGLVFGHTAFARKVTGSSTRPSRADRGR